MMFSLSLLFIIFELLASASSIPFHYFLLRCFFTVMLLYNISPRYPTPFEYFGSFPSMVMCFFPSRVATNALATGELRIDVNATKSELLDQMAVRFW